MFAEYGSLQLHPCKVEDLEWILPTTVGIPQFVTESTSAKVIPLTNPPSTGGASGSIFDDCGTRCGSKSTRTGYAVNEYNTHKGQITVMPEWKKIEKRKKSLTSRW